MTAKEVSHFKGVFSRTCGSFSLPVNRHMCPTGNNVLQGSRVSHIDVEAAKSPE